MSQRATAAELGITQPTVSQQANADVAVDAETLLEAAAPVLKELSRGRGFTDLALFGSVARGWSSMESDAELLVRPPLGATISDPDPRFGG